jgi:hypothetical protein
MSAEELAAILNAGMHRDLSEALMHPALAHALDQVPGIWTGGTHEVLGDFHRLLYEPFERVRRADPGRHLTFREFLRDDSQAAEVLEQIVGPDYLILATEQSGKRYFGARSRVLGSLGYDSPAVAQWLAWGHWGRDPVTVEVFAEMPGLLPVDFPQRRTIKRGPDAGSERWAYPDWGTGRTRLFQNLAYAELRSRLVNAAMPLDLNGPALFAALRQLREFRDPAALPFGTIAELRMSTLQVAQLMVEGRSPAYRTMLLPSGSPRPTNFILSQGPTGRAAWDARWELAWRLDEPGLITSNEIRFKELIQRHTAEDGFATRPATGNPDHPVTTLSNEELVAMAWYRHGCFEIAFQAYEVDHRRTQRMVPQLERLFKLLDQVVDADLLRHLCGLCDPHNLRVLSPEGHAAEDFFAALTDPTFPRGRGPRARADNRLRVQPVQGNRFVPNRTRTDHLYGLLPGPPPEPPAGVIRHDPGDLVDPYKFATGYDSHDGITRAMNGFFGFSPYHLEPVAALFQNPEVQAVLGDLFGQSDGDEIIATYNGFAGCLNAAMRAYGMDPALMPRLLIDGSWR